MKLYKKIKSKKELVKEEDETVIDVEDDEIHEVNEDESEEK